MVITGASSGLGEALAHTFYMAGCKVVLAARRKEELERVRTDLLEMHSVNFEERKFYEKYKFNILNGFSASGHSSTGLCANGRVRFEYPG